jgi:hypothetical protein
MIEHRPFNELGGEDHGWLKAKHHFSFADYVDPARIGWGSLRVWNDDEIAPNTGFPPHPHANMEIITYVREGAVTHKDSLGNEGRTEAGDVQVMSAGAGIRHAEYTESGIWINLRWTMGPVIRTTCVSVPPHAGAVQIRSSGSGPAIITDGVTGVRPASRSLWRAGLRLAEVCWQGGRDCCLPSGKGESRKIGCALIFERDIRRLADTEWHT